MKTAPRPSLVWLGVTTSMLMSQPDAMAQTGRQSVAQRSLRSLGELIDNIGDSYSELGAQQKKLQDDAAQLNEFATNFQSNQTMLNTARADYDTRAAAARSRRKWRCNRFGYLHNDPQECDDPSMGGVWIDDPGSPPPDPSDKAQLDAKQKDVDSQKADLDRKTRDYAKGAAEYNAKAADLTKKIASLPDPASAVTDVKQLVFDDYAAKGTAPDASTKKVLDALVGRGSIGDGQCTTAMHALFASMPPASDVKANKTDKVFGGTTAPLCSMALMATMYPQQGSDDLRYPSHSTGNHMVGGVPPKSGDSSLFFCDQYVNKPFGCRASDKHLGGYDAHLADIQQGEGKAKQLGLDPNNSKKKDSDGLDYWHRVYLEAHYNPSNDLDNLHYVRDASGNFVCLGSSGSR